ncbi:MAG: hypothetical protein FGM61_04255 [Sediminibacterium sp.]|nr:hypothetical protein [Sediminibacterium sp.]
MNDLFIYIEQVELIAFFSGLPVIWILINLLFGSKSIGIVIINRILPLVYGVLSVLYVGMKMDTYWTNMLAGWLFGNYWHVFLKCWAISAILFLLPIENKFFQRFSFFHALLFYTILLKDLILFFNNALSPELISNEWKMHLISIGLTAVLATILYFLLRSRFYKV